VTHFELSFYGQKQYGPGPFEIMNNTGADGVPNFTLKVDLTYVWLPDIVFQLHVFSFDQEQIYDITT
jgi:hypothetical protein